MLITLQGKEKELLIFALCSQVLSWLNVKAGFWLTLAKHQFVA